MRLPVPIFHNDNIYTDVEFDKPKASVVAEVSNNIQNGRIFSGLSIFLKGAIQSISNESKNVEDPVSIKSIVPKMPYRSAELISTQVMVKQYNGEDGVEGIYPCPLCGYKIVCQLQKTDDMEIDTRDFISDLKIFYQEEPQNTYKIQLQTPIIIKDKRDGSAIEEINDLEMYYPNLEHCMGAELKHGNNNEMKLQFGIYANALKAVNGEDIDNKYRNMIGVSIFENINDLANDFKAISDANSMYGIDPSIEKNCPECGKVWRPKLNTSNFFVSALRPK